MQLLLMRADADADDDDDADADADADAAGAAGAAAAAAAAAANAAHVDLHQVRSPAQVKPLCWGWGAGHDAIYEKVALDELLCLLQLLFCSHTIMSSLFSCLRRRWPPPPPRRRRLLLKK